MSNAVPTRDIVSNLHDHGNCHSSQFSLIRAFPRNFLTLLSSRVFEATTRYHTVLGHIILLSRKLPSIVTANSPQFVAKLMLCATCSNLPFHDIIISNLIMYKHPPLSPVSTPQARTYTRNSDKNTSLEFQIAPRYVSNHLTNPIKLSFQDIGMQFFQFGRNSKFMNIVVKTSHHITA